MGRGAFIGVLAALVALAGAAAAFAAFPQDPPNDPNYAPAEKPLATGCIDNEQWMLFDFIPRCTPLAKDPDGASGLSANRVWRDYTTGDPSVVIGYVEAGINWHSDLARDLANKVYLNAGELPPPTTPDNDPALSARDYADTPDYNGNGYVDPEDIIKRFSNGRDDDHNGYVDDISGWDFYDNQNDPATTDSAYEHSDTQMSRAAAEADNGIQGAGLCPRCRLLPIRAGAEAIDRGPELAQAWLFATDSHAQVVVSETAELGYTTFARRAAEYAYRHGTVIAESSNDFNSTDHQGGMFHPHVLPGNGLVPDREGMQSLTRLTTTYRQRSSVSSWGTHSVFSVPAAGGTTSASDPEVAGSVALITSAGRGLNPPLSAPEAVQVIRATASDIDDPSLAWPSKPGWDLQYGYGRPNLPKAAAAVRQGDIPPVAAIERPNWFSLYDPTRSKAKIPVSGWVKAPRTPHFRWQLQLAAAAEPGDGDFRQIGSGTGTRRFSGRLGRIDLRSIPKSFWQRAYALSQTKTAETTERYTVTLRLRVTDASGRVGEDRRTIAVQHDPTAVKHFPKRIGSGGGIESQPALADLQGRGRLAIVFGTSDGVVHALDSRTGRELKGWPVRTRAIRPTRRHRGVPAGHEPVVANVDVADLNGDGRPEVIAAGELGRLYVWEANGKRRRGFPRALATGIVTPPIPRPAWPYRRYPAHGAVASPVIGDLNGDGRMEIVQAAWDGRLYAFEPNGKQLPGWPVRPKLPDDYNPGGGQVVVNDEKLDGTPTLADLDGDKKIEVVERSQQTDITPGDISFAPHGHVYAYKANGKPVPGWPVTLQGLAEAYGTAQEFITEGAGSPVAADVDGDGKDEIAVNTELSHGFLLNGDGSVRTTYGEVPAATVAAVSAGLDPQAALSNNLPNDAPVNFTTSGAFGRFGGGLSFAQPGSGAVSIASTIEFPGLGKGINNYERAFDAASGAPRNGFPAKLQGLDFLGAPLFTDVTGDGNAEIVDGGDSSALHAYLEGGGQAPGFPKFTSGWMPFSPAAGDLNGDGTTELVIGTREGYIMAWHTPGKAGANDQWWRWHHDERSSGRYGTDVRPPGAVRRARVKRGRLTFLAPGDDWYAGGAARYRIRIRGGRVRKLPRPLAAGRRQTIRLPRGARRITITAVDDAGNVGPPVTLPRHR